MKLHPQAAKPAGWARVSGGLKHALWGPLAFLVFASASASAQNTIYLLGEVHDNPKAHAQRFEFIEKLLAQNFRPAIAMEQFDREKQDLLNQAMNSCKDSACVIQKAGGRGWEWKYYQPVIDTALKLRLPIIAANLSSQDAMKVVRGGWSAALSAETIREFNLDLPLEPDLFQKQKIAIEVGHCNMLPASAVKGMVNAQVARDVWMAKTIRDNAAGGLILLAGNGHVRKDIGVYHWLSSAERARTQVIAYTEEETNTASASEPAVYDRSVRIEPFERGDPCEAFTGKRKTQT